jgi:uncharacterized protein (TIGR02271 family)
MTNDTTSPYTGLPVEDWYDYEIKLHDADGDTIGDVVEVNPDFIVCETDGGFLGLGEHRRYFVPRNFVAREEQDDWYLSIDKDEIESKNWTNAPTTSQFGGEWSGGDYAGETTDTQGRTRLRRYEEDVNVDKVQRAAGEVVVNKRVVEEVKTIEVPVRREEVHVERRPVDDNSPVSAFSNEAFTEDSIRVPVMAEEVEVRKVARPVEEIEITKSAVDENRNVDTTVRREEFDIDDSTKR